MSENPNSPRGVEDILADPTTTEAKISEMAREIGFKGEEIEILKRVYFHKGGDNDDGSHG